MRDCAWCGHPWEWHGPGKDCMCGGCAWFDWPTVPNPPKTNDND